MRKSHIFVPPERERERCFRQSTSYPYEMEDAAPPLRVSVPGRAGGWIDPSRAVYVSFRPCVYWRRRRREKKKLFSIDLRAPTPPTRSLTSTTLWLFFSLFRYERKEERGGRCKVKVESCGDYRTDGSVNFEFCWPFYFCRRRKQKREGERTSCHLSNTFSIMTSFFPLENFFGFLWENSRLYLNNYDTDKVSLLDK
jgi:hypothetical protein